MDYNTIFVGMGVHKEKFSLCCYSIEKVVLSVEDSRFKRTC